MQKNLRRELDTFPQPVPVVVDAGWMNGLGIVRSLAAAGLRCIALSSMKDGIGLRSKTALGMVCPDPKIDPQAFVAFMLDLGKQLPGKGLLLVTDDTYMLTLAGAREQLEPYFIYSFPEINTLTRMMDKWEQYRCAEEECGLPIARTTPVDSVEDLDKWPDAAFPAILKGRLGKAFYNRSGSQVVEVHNRGELVESFKKFKDYNLLLQEIIPGGDENLYTLGSYISPTGQILGTFTGRKLRQKPEFYGTCRQGESLNVPDVLAYGLKLLRYFRFYGISQVEFKLDPRDRKFKLIEINGRFWLWHTLATYCGVNLSAIAYNDLSGHPVQPCLQQVYGPKWGMGLYDFLKSVRSLPRGGSEMKQFLQYFRGPHIDAVFSWNDPAPVWPYFLRLIG